MFVIRGTTNPLMAGIIFFHHPCQWIKDIFSLESCQVRVKFIEPVKAASQVATAQSCADIGSAVNQ
jgi:hypothetical protein